MLNEHLEHSGRGKTSYAGSLAGQLGGLTRALTRLCVEAGGGLAAAFAVGHRLAVAPKAAGLTDDLEQSRISGGFFKLPLFTSRVPMVGLLPVAARGQAFSTLLEVHPTARSVRQKRLARSLRAHLYPQGTPRRAFLSLTLGGKEGQVLLSVSAPS